jgi:hypothetical protein
VVKAFCEDRTLNIELSTSNIEHRTSNAQTHVMRDARVAHRRATRDAFGSPWKAGQVSRIARRCATAVLRIAAFSVIQPH